jgi:DNA-binding transcriptional ArsR family regulator
MQPYGCIYSSVDIVFKALADPGRRQLLDQLHQKNGQTLRQLCQHLNMTRQGVTKHLQLLHQANLVVHLWRGREKLHYLNPTPLVQISERWIDKYPGRIPRALRELETALAEVEKITAQESSGAGRSKEQ